MELQKINVKFFVEDPSRITLTDFIDIFHSWIQGSDGAYHDVADYSHVPAGPGILLIAYEANISIDNTNGRLGLLYNRKRPLPGPNRERLLSVFRSALEACRRVEEEPSLRGSLKFRGSEALFLINDRLLAPNTPETFRALKPDLEELAQTLYGGADFALRHNADSRERFSVLISTPRAFEVGTVLGHIASA